MWRWLEACDEAPYDICMTMINARKNSSPGGKRSGKPEEPTCGSVIRIRGDSMSVSRSRRKPNRWGPTALRGKKSRRCSDKWSCDCVTSAGVTGGKRDPSALEVLSPRFESILIEDRSGYRAQLSNRKNGRSMGKRKAGLMKCAEREEEK
ncbi:hypothetical protein CDAR_263161 [Caerostris darwini]|uniref:Uncharacterized protein n=1 Tax=Caerostris darwini TaxID=1538125 RepID=A0AAV4RUQ6_9ARAC|nr:hypothetical protein CDAR_263161 [Caerostris darwini]